MTATPSDLGRRGALRALAGLAAASLPARTMAQTAAQTAPATFADGAQMTVAGPEGGELDDWARILIPAIGGYLPPHTNFRRAIAGGTDGLTGANQFAAQALPDGTGVLLAPGSAFMGWLRGDARVQFDAMKWTTLLTGLCPTILAGRLDASQLVRGQKLRIGVSGPNGPELSAVLGLQLLGLQPVPVTGLMDQAATELAFAQHTIDLMLLRGPATAKTIAEARPLCALGLPGADGSLTRDPAWLDLPHLGELLGGLPRDQLTAGWSATAFAAQLAFALVLPPLTASAHVSLWRNASISAIVTPELQAMATAQTMRLRAGSDAIAPLTSDPEALRALRAWNGERPRR